MARALEDKCLVTAKVDQTKMCSTRPYVNSFILVCNMVLQFKLITQDKNLKTYESFRLLLQPSYQSDTPLDGIRDAQGACRLMAAATVDESFQILK